MSAHGFEAIPPPPVPPRDSTILDSSRTNPAPAAPGRARMLWIGLSATLALIAVVVAVLVVRARGKASSDQAAAPARDVPHLEGGLVHFSPDFAKRSGIKTAAVTEQELLPQVSVTGTVKFDPKRVAAIGARIPGRVRKIHKVPGDHVKKGDALAEIESAELGKAQSAALSARAHAQAATANEKREAQLAEAKVSSARDAELAKANAEAARADLHAAEQAVRALAGGGLNGEMGVLVLRSPIDGKIVESGIYQGQTLDSTDMAFRVADLSRLWVELAVFERELSSIHAEDPVDIAPGAERKHVEKGRVAYVGDVIDVHARSAPVRVEIDNDAGQLRPGQSVVARIHTRAPLQKAITVPLTAVTRVDGVPKVFVSHGETSVEARTVEIGMNDGVRAHVLSGLKPGEVVVVEGVFALKSELFR